MSIAPDIALPLLSSIVAHVTAIRHDLHRHPELAYQEHYTSDVVSRELTRLGIDHRRGLAGTGIVALIEGAPGRCVALRADMDALPVQEVTGLPYASTKPGLMHACGHDGHTAILLGAAAVLKAMASELRGSVKLIFQPAEEGGRGADRMCKDGVLENPKVDAVFGLHGWPGLKVGQVASRPGPLLASVDGFEVVISGKGTHAASPHDGIDPIVCGSAIVQALQTIVSRELDATEPAVVTVGQFHAGTAFNIIPETATLGGTVRALGAATRDRIVEAIERICRGIAAAHRCRCEITFSERTPPTVNTPAQCDFVRDTAADTLGRDNYLTSPRPAMWGEDFAFYLQHVPGCFFVLGVCPHDRAGYPMLHNAAFDFNDAAIPHGIRMMTALAKNFLNR